MNLCVLIPAKDERLGIGKTVQSVLDAGASARDIYVIDDGSSDGTGEIAKSFEEASYGTRKTSARP
jgi:glycosyltransferase involved in cell wall biosynthesis